MTGKTNAAPSPGPAPSDASKSDVKATLVEWLNARDALDAAQRRLDELSRAAHKVMTTAQLTDVAVQNKGKTYMVKCKPRLSATELTTI